MGRMGKLLLNSDSIFELEPQTSLLFSILTVLLRPSQESGGGVVATGNIRGNCTQLQGRNTMPNLSFYDSEIQIALSVSDSSKSRLRFGSM